MPSIDGPNVLPFIVGYGRPSITVDIIQGQDPAVIGQRQLPNGLLYIDPDGQKFFDLFIDIGGYLGIQFIHPLC